MPNPKLASLCYNRWVFSFCLGLLLFIPLRFGGLASQFVFVRLWQGPSLRLTWSCSGLLQAWACFSSICFACPRLIFISLGFGLLAVNLVLFTVGKLLWFASFEAASICLAFAIAAFSYLAWVCSACLLVRWISTVCFEAASVLGFHFDCLGDSRFSQFDLLCFSSLWTPCFGSLVALFALLCLLCLFLKLGCLHKFISLSLRFASLAWTRFVACFAWFGSSVLVQIVSVLLVLVYWHQQVPEVSAYWWAGHNEQWDIEAQAGSKVGPHFKSLVDKTISLGQTVKVE